MVAKVLNYKEDPKVRSMRVRTWFRSVEMASGLTTRELERLFSDGGAEKVKRSCIWNKYRAGTVAPRSGRSEKGLPNLVERVEKRYPGTAKWLTSPLWRLISPAPLEMSEIREVYEGLPVSLKALFIEQKSTAKGLFWRHPADPKDVFDALVAERGEDALIAALAMMREAVVIQDQWQHWLGATAVQNILALLNAARVATPFPIYLIYQYLKANWSSPGFFGEDSDLPQLWSEE